eukprot:UN01852
MASLSIFRSNALSHKLIQLNSYSFFNYCNTVKYKWVLHWNSYNVDCILQNEPKQCNDNETLDIKHNNNNAILDTIFSEGILFKRGPGTSARKYSKCRTRKRMSRVGFLARIRTYNGRKIIQRQRRKGRRYLGAKL